MVNPRFFTYLYIVMIVVIFVLAQPVNSKKHRVFHSLPHQHRHQTHHHRKPHAKIHHNHRHHHLPLMKKISRSITTNNYSSVFFNLTNFPRSTDSLANESAASEGSNFSTNSKIKSAFSDKSTRYASSQFDYFSNDFSTTTTNSRSSNSFPFRPTLSSTPASIPDARETIANLLLFGINRLIDDPSKKSTFNRSLAFTNMTGELIVNRRLDGTEFEKDKIVPRGETEKTVTDGQSISSTGGNNVTTYNREKFVKELEELFGPTEEPKDLSNNVDTPLVVLVRKKRSNEEKESGEHEPKTRTLLDFEGPDTADETENLEDSLEVPHKRVKRNDPMDFDENPYALNPNYLQDLEDSFAPSALEIQAQKSDEETLRKAKLWKNNPRVSDDKFRLKRDTNYANYEGNGEVDPTNGMTRKTSEREIEHRDVWAGSSIIQSPEKSFGNDEISGKKYFTVIMDSSRLTSLDSSDPLTSGSGKNSASRHIGGDFSREEKSAGDPENLQDDNSVSRYGLNDVYPDAVEDSQPESMHPLVRTKRFEESFVYPEVPDVSYAINEIPGSGRVVPEEPYAEDNEIIDSMLNKVEAVSPEDTRDGDYKKMESVVDDEPKVSLRDKRDAGKSWRAKRRFGGYGGLRKHIRKNRRRKKKKKNRHRAEGYEKRGALLISDREYRKEAAQPERVAPSKEDEDRFHEIYDQDVMSPHDGRRRRDYEDETNDNLHYNINEPALGQVERQPRESQAPRASGGDGILDDEASREKRGTRRDEDANDSSQISDKNSIGPRHAEPIRDIQELVQKLLVKVNELAINVNDVNAEPLSSTNNVPQCSKTTAKTISQIGEAAPRAIQEAIVAEKPTGNPVNSMRRRKSCWESLTPDRDVPKSARPWKSMGEGCEGIIRRKRKPGRKWDRWTDWSSCSVTCGKGRQIRWRHCLRNCSTAETEMEEKACQFPACAPGKFLGIFG